MECKWKINSVSPNGSPSARVPAAFSRFLIKHGFRPIRVRTGTYLYYNNNIWALTWMR